MLIILSKIRGELAAVVVDGLLAETLAQTSDPAAAANLTSTCAGLVETYKRGRPLKYVQEVLDEDIGGA